MKKSDFYYDLPNELIAQHPAEPRDSSRMLCVDRNTGATSHKNFYQFPDFLNKGDLLVLNDSKVFPARLLGKKRGSGIETELLLLEEKSGKPVTDGIVWEAAARPGRRLKTGDVVDFTDGTEVLSAEILETTADGNKIVRFITEPGVDFFNLLEKFGQTPLPPYITRKIDDPSRYNTVYSRETGSSAAPTAGLHFTERVFGALRSKGVDTAFVTLHVGLGTFRPVKTENILQHKMHSEHFTVTAECAEKINACRSRGGRIIAAGTTSCRVLESASQKSRASGNTPTAEPLSASTDIFIYPGYEFGLTDGLLTNFHLPESTLIMLVSAFLGRERTLKAYAEAIREKYRFFSFGDCCLII